jgi:hypothetical protein
MIDFRLSGLPFHHKQMGRHNRRNVTPICLPEISSPTITAVFVIPICTFRTARNLIMLSMDVAPSVSSHVPLP